MKAIALKQLHDEDFVTQSVRKYEDIPRGATVEYIKNIKNLYGIFALVEYNGVRYYVKPLDLELG